MKKTLLLTALLAAGAANADTLTFSDFHSTPLQDVPFTDLFNLAKFNTNLGILDSITLTLTADVTGAVDVSNSKTYAQDFTNASSSVPVTFTGPAGTHTTVTATTTVASGQVGAAFLSPYGLVDGVKHLTGLSSTGTNSVDVAVADFSNYEGSGIFTAAFSTVAGDGSYTGTGPTGVSFGGSAVADATATVTYTYHTAPVPEADSAAFLALGLGLVGLLARRRSFK